MVTIATCLLYVCSLDVQVYFIQGPLYIHMLTFANKGQGHCQGQGHGLSWQYFLHFYFILATTVALPICPDVSDDP